jgi:hypothetical protein
VTLDSELSELQVPAKRLNEAVKRNRGRLPDDFMFQLTKQGAEVLSSQMQCQKAEVVVARSPTLFTRHGVAMLSSVLNSRSRRANEYSHHPRLHKRSASGHQ